MKYVFAVFDHATQLYGQPFFTVAKGAAIRSFTDEVNRPAQDNELYKHPGDYDLWYLGEFEETRGTFVRSDESAPAMLVRGKDVQTKGGE